MKKWCKHKDKKHSSHIFVRYRYRKGRLKNKVFRLIESLGPFRVTDLTVC